jgi:RimK family alpha-L-glutamate ligase
LTGWLIYPRYTSLLIDNAYGWLQLEARKKGLDVRILFVEEFSLRYGEDRSTLLYEDAVVEEYPAFVVMRCYDHLLSRHFELRGVPVVNSSRSMLLCKDKMLTHQLLACAGIPSPLTVCNGAGIYDYKDLCAVLGSERFIVKRTDGSKGEDVYLVSDPAQLKVAVDRCGGHPVCQRFIESSAGRDVRVWVIGGEVAGSVLRYSETSFISNFSQGGRAVRFELPEQARELALRAAEVCGLEFAGVDLLFTEEGFTVCELNGNAGFRTLSLVGGNDIPAALFGYIAKIIKPF